jgi:hypothetical protein
LTVEHALGDGRQIVGNVMVKGFLRTKRFGLDGSRPFTASSEPLTAATAKTICLVGADHMVIRVR